MSEAFDALLNTRQFPENNLIAAAATAIVVGDGAVGDGAVVGGAVVGGDSVVLILDDGEVCTPCSHCSYE